MHFKFFLVMTFVAIFGSTLAYFGYIAPMLFTQKTPLVQTEMPTSVSNVQTHSLNPLISNQWFSSIYNSFPTNPLYALPLAYRLSASGLEISYPLVTASADEITAPFATDIIVSNGNAVQSVKVTGVGDWHVQASATDNQRNIFTMTMGHGIPYVTVNDTGGNAEIELKKQFTVSSNGRTVSNSAAFTSDTLVLKSTSAIYMVLLPESSQIRLQNNTITISNTEKVVVALVDSEKNAELFTSLRDTDITDTQSYPTTQQEDLNVQYNLSTSNKNDPLVALYPHQYDNLQSPLQKIGEYRSIRGPLNLYQTSTFTTSTETIVPKTSYDPISRNSSQLKEQITKDVDEIIQTGPPSDKVYFQGTWFGKVGSLILLADSQGMLQEKQKLVGYIEPIFLKSLEDFTYDKNKTSLIAEKSEFGNDQLNDHHFHYGYYIRLAAILGSTDLAFVDKTNGVIDAMVNDIATINRQDTKHPFLRNFDIYESHSWADGYGNSPLGNNQESSSEAINAWYSLYLWAQITRNTNLSQYALYLYNAEIIGAKYYWFDIADLYKAPYKHAIASQVWGGKVTFSTWFSGETNMKYGIQLLPLTPGSEYLGTFESFEPYESSYDSAGGSTSDEWGDLLIAWKAMYDGSTALTDLRTVGKLEGNDFRSNLLYYVYKNN